MHVNECVGCSFFVLLFFNLNFFFKIITYSDAESTKNRKKQNFFFLICFIDTRIFLLYSCCRTVAKCGGYLNYVIWHNTIIKLQVRATEMNGSGYRLTDQPNNPSKSINLFREMEFFFFRSRFFFFGIN